MQNKRIYKYKSNKNTLFILFALMIASLASFIPVLLKQSEKIEGPSLIFGVVGLIGLFVGASYLMVDLVSRSYYYEFSDKSMTFVRLFPKRSTVSLSVDEIGRVVTFQLKANARQIQFIPKKNNNIKQNTVSIPWSNYSIKGFGGDKFVHEIRMTVEACLNQGITVDSYVMKLISSYPSPTNVE